MKIVTVKLFVLLFLLSFLATFSYGDSLDSILSDIQQSYDAVRDFKASFVQESSVKSWNAMRVQKAEGMVYFKKEGKMHWDYQRPTPQQIISDGKKLWFYEPEDNQVTIADVGAGLHSQISADLLNGKANLKRDFLVQLVASKEEEDKGRLVLELTPRVTQSNFNRVVLKVDKKTFLIYQTEVYDLFDNLTRIEFSQMKINTNLPDTWFVFVPPPGVEVLTPPNISLP